MHKYAFDEEEEDEHKIAKCIQEYHLYSACPERRYSLQQWLLMVRPRTGVLKYLVGWGKLACNTSKLTLLLHTFYTHASV